MKYIGLCLVCLNIMCGFVFASINYSSTTVGGPSWDRPYADGTCCSTLGPVVYHVQEFVVNSAGTIDISSAQDGFDGYIFVYANAFDPSNKTANFVAGDDDGNGGIGTSDIEGLSVSPGTYFLVTTGFSNGNEGTFTNTIVGDVSFPSIPTLSEWGMIILFLFLLCTGTIILYRKKSGCC